MLKCEKYQDIEVIFNSSNDVTNAVLGGQIRPPGTAKGDLVISGSGSGSGSYHIHRGFRSGEYELKDLSFLVAEPKGLGDEPPPPGYTFGEVKPR